ncbi:MAG: CPBP family intramembrane metalloprotease [Myxococcales bacterium]|nr:CPBP family intramembrane metalloprotease [Myxococcales bacterium]
MPSPLAWWLVLPVVALVIALDYAIVGPWALDEQGLRLLPTLAVALGLRRWLGPAGLPLRWGSVHDSMRWVGKVVGVGAIVCVLVGVGALAAAHLGGMRWPLRPANFHHPDQYLTWLVPAVIWAPLIEEIVYRGIVQAYLRPLTGPWVAIAISGLTFWVYHWVSFEKVTSPHHLGAGLLLAWSYERTRSLLAPMVLHAVGNLVLGTSDLVYLLWPERVHAALGWS